MESSSINYPESLLEFIVQRIPREMIRIFIFIVKHKNKGGVTWTDLVDHFEKRYFVEKALLLFETNGFITLQSATADKRSKRYIPDEVRGRQLAEFLNKRKQRSITNGHE